MQIEIQLIEGRTLCLVPVFPKQIAKVWSDDLRVLIKLGVSPMWHVMNKTIRTSGKHAGRHLQVSRLIADAGPGEIVRYKNGDYLDLRKENLLTLKGHGKKRDRDEITPPQRSRYKKAQEVLETLGL